MIHILVVEDDVSISEPLKKFIEREQFQCTVFNTGEGVIDFIATTSISLAVLDIELPSVDGLTLCHQIRTKYPLPIIMLTAKSFEQDRINGLKAGADDYVCKPFSAPELILRMKGILRRTESVIKNNMGELVVDKNTLSAAFKGNTIKLTKIECALLVLLSSQPNRVFSRDQIIDRVYDDYHVISDRTIDSHISKFKRKLGQVSPDYEFIQSVYGVGYRYVPFTHQQLR